MTVTPPGAARGASATSYGRPVPGPITNKVLQRNVLIAVCTALMAVIASVSGLTVAQQNLAALAAAAIDLLAVPRTDRGSHVEIPTRLKTRASCGCGTTGEVLLPSVTLQPAAPATH